MPRNVNSSDDSIIPGDELSPLRFSGERSSSGSGVFQGGSPRSDRGKKKSLDRKLSVLEMVEMWEGGAKANVVASSVEILPDNVVQQSYGIGLDFLSHMHMLSDMGVTYTMRAKHKLNLNTRHEIAGWKGSETKAKSIKRAAAERGWLTEDKKYSQNELTRTYQDETLAKLSEVDRERLSEVFTRPDLDKFGAPQYLTFERQTLRYIDEMIAGGKYTVVNREDKDFGVGKKDKVFYRIVKDKTGAQFMLRYENFHESKFVTGSGSPVSSAAKRFDAKSVPYSKPRITRAKSFKEVAGNAIQIRLNNNKSYASYEKLQSIITANIDKTIKLLPYDPTTDKVQTLPTINCTDLGYRIKGDVDLQVSLFPLDLPMIAYAYLGDELTEPYADGKMPTKKQGLIRALETLKNELLSLPHDENYHDHIRQSMYVQAAINNLNKKDGKAFLSDTVVDRLGTISLFDAAIALAINGEILHGSDAGSPLYPEDIQVTKIPNPKDSRKFIVTHGEFELLQTLLTQPEFENKIMSYNPCHFVVGDFRKDTHTENKEIEVVKQLNGTYKALDVNDTVGLIGSIDDVFTREDGSTFARVKIDTTISFDGKSHPALNKTDEQYIIKMHRLLLERNLLVLRSEYSFDEFEKYIKVLQNNFQVMEKNLYKDKEGLENTFKAGKEVIDHIIEKVEKTVYVDARLEAINKIINQPDASALRSSLSRTNLDRDPLESKQSVKSMSGIVQPRSRTSSMASSRPRPRSTRS